MQCGQEIHLEEAREEPASQHPAWSGHCQPLLTPPSPLLSAFPMGPATGPLHELFPLPGTPSLYLINSNLSFGS